MVSADTGPKPTTEITIRNLEKSDYIVAYATKYDNYANHSRFIPGDEHCGKTYFGNADDLTLLYYNVTLPEEFYLFDISYFFKDATELVCKSGYMWPDEFMLIIYNKANSNYYLTTETKTYAFNSYFSYDMNDLKGKPIELQKNIPLAKSYNYGKEIGEFFLRLVVTLSIEMLLALLFRFTKKSLLVIGITNAVTQIGLNISLNLFAHYHGKSPYILIIYALIELAIIAVEAIVYKKFCKRGKDENKHWIIAYTLLANVLSFGLGMVLWYLI